MNKAFVTTLDHDASHEFQHMVDSYLIAKLFSHAFKAVVASAYGKKIIDVGRIHHDPAIHVAIQDEIDKNHLFLFWVSSKQTPNSAWDSRDEEEMESSTEVFPVPFYELSQQFETHFSAIGLTVSKADSDLILNEILKKQDKNHYWVNEYYGSGTGLDFIALSNKELIELVNKR